MFIGCPFTGSIADQRALARICVATMVVGVPVGAQTAWLLCTRRGCPFETTRVVPTSHCAVTQGPLAAGGGGNVHPATTYGAASVTVGCPLTVTRGFGTVGCAWPACVHST